MLILNSTVVFLSSVPKIPFLGKFSPKTSKCFVQNKTLREGLLKAANHEFKNSFFKFGPNNIFLGKIWSQNFKVVCLEQNSLQTSIQECRF